MQVRNKKKKSNTPKLLVFPVPLPLGPEAFNKSLSEPKKEALFSMLSTMPLEDKNFYIATVLKDFEKTKKAKQTTKPLVKKTSKNSTKNVTKESTQATTKEATKRSIRTNNNKESAKKA